jgi:hypothetical protein
MDPAKVKTYQRPRLGLDIGDVLSSTNPRCRKQEGDEIYRSATPGAYAFIVCFILRFGAEQLFVISRTQRGSWWSAFRGRTVEAWVVRFIRALGLFDMGMPESHMSICTDQRGLKGKGPLSLQYDLAHFVDNSDQCGYAVVVEGSISHRNGFWIHFDTNVADLLIPHTPLKAASRTASCVCNIVARLLLGQKLQTCSVWTFPANYGIHL